MRDRRAKPFTSGEIHHLNREYPNGLTTGEILDILAAHRITLGEPTFRKYVRLGLLPKCTRVGTRGQRFQGSYGLYPVAVLSLIVRIRHLVSTTTLSIETIQVRLAFGLKMSEVQIADAELFRLLEQALRTPGLTIHETHKHRGAIARARQELIALRKGMHALYRELAAASQPLERRLSRAA